MSGSLFYLMTYLPVLPALGETPPTGFPALEKLVSADEDGTAARRALNAAVLEQAVCELVHRKVVTRENWDFGDESELAEILPEELRAACAADLPENREAAWITDVWKAYYAHVRFVGASIGSLLLAAWADWEEALRLRLEYQRLETVSMTSAIDADSPWDHSALISAWTRSLDPLEGERILDRGRIAFLEERAVEFSFSLDEFVAYLLKLRLLNRYAALDRRLGVKILEEVANP